MRQARGSRDSSARGCLGRRATIAARGRGRFTPWPEARVLDTTSTPAEVASPTQWPSRTSARGRSDDPAVRAPAIGLRASGWFRGTRRRGIATGSSTRRPTRSSRRRTIPDDGSRCTRPAVFAFGPFWEDFARDSRRGPHAVREGALTDCYRAPGGPTLVLLDHRALPRRQDCARDLTIRTQPRAPRRPSASSDPQDCAALGPILRSEGRPRRPVMPWLRCDPRASLDRDLDGPDLRLTQLSHCLSPPRRTSGDQDSPRRRRVQRRRMLVCVHEQPLHDRRLTHARLPTQRAPPKASRTRTARVSSASPFGAVRSLECGEPSVRRVGPEVPRRGGGRPSRHGAGRSLAESDVTRHRCCMFPNTIVVPLDGSEFAARAFPAPSFVHQTHGRMLPHVDALGRRHEVGALVPRRGQRPRTRMLTSRRSFFADRPAAGA